MLSRELFDCEVSLVDLDSDTVGSSPSQIISKDPGDGGSCKDIQWTLSNPAILATSQNVLIRGMASFQG